MTDCISSSLFYKAGFTESFLYHFFSFRFWKSFTKISIQDLDVSDRALTTTKDLPLLLSSIFLLIHRRRMYLFIIFLFFLQQQLLHLTATSFWETAPPRAQLFSFCTCDLHLSYSKLDLVPVWMQSLLWTQAICQAIQILLQSCSVNSVSSNHPPSVTANLLLSDFFVLLDSH